MGTWDMDVVVRLAERLIGGDTLQTWHNNFAATGTS